MTRTTLVGLALVYVVRQWTRRALPAAAGLEPAPRRDELDERIDAELRDLD